MALVDRNRRLFSSQQNELHELKALLRRVTEEINILKEASAYFAGGQGKIRVHKIETRPIFILP